MPPNSHRARKTDDTDLLKSRRKGLMHDNNEAKSGPEGDRILPQKISGSCTMMTLGLLSVGLAYELKLQRDLTRPPVVFGQLPSNTVIRKVYEALTASPNSILSRSIKPSLFVGTRAQLASVVAFMSNGPTSQPENFERFREMINMAADGAQLAVDWEVPAGTKNDILHGRIKQPVIIILHGINNHSEFGYMKSLQRAFCCRGWNAAAVNFRGCGGVKMTTPRGYTAAYTGDLRGLVLQLSLRMQNGVRIFLVGNSLGANIVTKYLGEEGLAGTLPKAVAGGVSLGNPILFRANQIKFPHNILIGMARKRTYWEQREAVSSMNDAASMKAKQHAIWSHTVGQLDHAVSLLMIRNDAFPPYGLCIGYNSGEEYWQDSGSCVQSRFISVPLMHVAAQDDFLCYSNSRRLMAYALSNPNIMVVETRCGGHLGWQETRHPSTWFGMDSWADEATADFIQAVFNHADDNNESHSLQEHAQDFATMIHSKL
jgi:predicted alpha/beta-fold hydrolase